MLAFFLLYTYLLSRRVRVEQVQAALDVLDEEEPAGTPALLHARVGRPGEGVGVFPADARGR
jgi:hypothetical protein